jgi:hypothetical protein
MSGNRLFSKSVVLRGLLTTTALVTAAGSGLTEAQAACYTGSFPYTNAGTVACIVVANTSFTGNLSNTGTISPSGIAVTGSTITGSILSSGTLIGGISIDTASRINSAGSAIYISGPSFSGGITNNGNIFAHNTGIDVYNTSFSGGITNNGAITSQSNYGIYASATNFSGGIVNAGSINSYY